MSAALGAAVGAFVGVWMLHVVRCVAFAFITWRFDSRLDASNGWDAHQKRSLAQYIKNRLVLGVSVERP